MHGPVAIICWGLSEQPCRVDIVQSTEMRRQVEEGGQVLLPR